MRGLAAVSASLLLASAAAGQMPVAEPDSIGLDSLRPDFLEMAGSADTAAIDTSLVQRAVFVLRPGRPPLAWDHGPAPPVALEISGLDGRRFRTLAGHLRSDFPLVTRGGEDLFERILLGGGIRGDAALYWEGVSLDDPVTGRADPLLFPLLPSDRVRASELAAAAPLPPGGLGPAIAATARDPVVSIPYTVVLVERGALGTDRLGIRFSRIISRFRLQAFFDDPDVLNFRPASVSQGRSSGGSLGTSFGVDWDLGMRLWERKKDLQWPAPEGSGAEGGGRSGRLQFRQVVVSRDPADTTSTRWELRGTSVFHRTTRDTTFSGPAFDGWDADRIDAAATISGRGWLFTAGWTREEADGVFRRNTTSGKGGLAWGPDRETVRVGGAIEHAAGTGRVRGAVTVQRDDDGVVLALPRATWWRRWRESGRLFATAGRGGRPASFAERLWPAGLDGRAGNTALESWTVDGVEVGAVVEGHLRIVGFASSLAEEPVEGISPQNQRIVSAGPRKTSAGVKARVLGVLPGGWVWGAGGIWIDDPVPLLPRIGWRAEIRRSDPFLVGRAEVTPRLELHGAGRRAPHPSALLPGAELPPYELVDASLDARIQDLTLSWSWRNVLSEPYEPLPGLRAARRRATLWIRWEFFD